MLKQGKFDDKFRLQIIDEYLNGTPKYTLSKKYKFSSGQHITRWMKELGIEDPCYSENREKHSTQNNIMKQDSDLTTKKSKFYNKRIAELEKLLAEERLVTQALTKVIDVAEKELNLDIKKKYMRESSKK